MQRSHVVAALALVLAGAATGAFAAKKLVIDPATYSGKSPQEAGAALLSAAQTLTEGGTFENIACGRVLYLSGSKQEGKALFDRVLAGKHDGGDLIRIARVYAEAGEWAAAKPLFDQVVESAPKDEDWLAEVGAAYVRAGDRTHGEELYARSLAQDPSNLRNALRMATAYLGVAAP
jgi:tetratricopeptide (TPR) repeat protein